MTQRFLAPSPPLKLGHFFWLGVGPPDICHFEGRAVYQQNFRLVFGKFKQLLTRRILLLTYANVSECSYFLVIYRVLAALRGVIYRVWAALRHRGFVL